MMSQPEEPLFLETLKLDILKETDRRRQQLKDEQSKGISTNLIILQQFNDQITRLLEVVEKRSTETSHVERIVQRYAFIPERLRRFMLKVFNLLSAEQREINCQLTSVMRRQLAVLSSMAEQMDDLQNTVTDLQQMLQNTAVTDDDKMEVLNVSASVASKQIRVAALTKSREEIEEA